MRTPYLITVDMQDGTTYQDILIARSENEAITSMIHLILAEDGIDAVLQLYSIVALMAEEDDLYLHGLLTSTN